VTEIVHPRNGAAVRLRPCPSWCTLSRHFSDDWVVDADDGFHHHGPEIAVPTSDRMLRNDPETVVKVNVSAWTSRLDAEPDAARVNLVLGTAEYNTDMYVELTAGEARAISAALLKLAEVAARTDPAPTEASSRNDNRT
jgi:hypothetical protein